LVVEELDTRVHEVENVLIPRGVHEAFADSLETNDVHGTANVPKEMVPVVAEVLGGSTRQVLETK
jgi:hypothetical protein